jgi:hypothetical protein
MAKKIKKLVGKTRNKPIKARATVVKINLDMTFSKLREVDKFLTMFKKLYPSARATQGSIKLSKKLGKAASKPIRIPPREVTPKHTRD